MKVDVIFCFIFLFVQASASFYGQFRGAMSNVERGFGKLLSDVVFDVKDTLQCTISAVQQVLAKNGFIEETSDYNTRCRGYAQPKIPKDLGYRQRNFFEERFSNTQPIKQLSPETELEKISKELESSISNVNRSINDILHRRETNGNFKVITEFLKNETERLNAVSDLLRRELENISVNVRNHIEKLHADNKKPPRETIWEDLQALHDFKGRSNNKTEINEITNVIDKVVNEMHVTPSDKVLSENEKLDEIKKELNKYTNEQQNTQTVIINTKEMAQTQIGTEKEIKSFKELAQNIMNNDKRLIAESNLVEALEQEASQGSDAEKSLLGEDTAVVDSSSPFYNPVPNADTKKIVEDAKTIMEESKKSEELLNMFFNKRTNEDFFNSGNMFNFG